MKKLLCAALAVLFLLAAGCVPAGNPGDGYTVTHRPQSPPSDTPRDDPPGPPPAEPSDDLPDEPGPPPSAQPSPFQEKERLIWKVEPTYDSIDYIFWAGVILFDGLMLNLATGEVSEDPGYDFATGGLSPPDVWLYDEGKDLYGLYGTREEYAPAEFQMFTPAEFLEFCDYYLKYLDTDGKNRLRAFRKIDSDKVTQYEEDHGWIVWVVYDLSGAYIGDRSALIYGTEFVTDFIFDHDFDVYTNNRKNAVATMLEGKWGIVNRYGEAAVPFILDAIVFIDDETAFALYGGLWGILDIAKTASLQ